MEPALAKLAVVAAVVAAALVGGADAGRIDGQFGSDELGIDCGGDGQADCTCWTDMRSAIPFAAPTVVYDGAGRHTGLGESAGDGPTLQVVVDLDSSIYTRDAANVEDGVTHPISFGTAPDYRLSEFTDGFVTANRYVNPRVFFIDADDRELPNCVFTDTGAANASTSTADAGALFITRPSTSAAAQYGVDGDECSKNPVQVHFRADLWEVIGNCGFTSTRDPSSTEGSVYNRYEGRFKVLTSRQNGELRGNENVLTEEYRREISVVLPEAPTVASSAAAVVGDAVLEAEVTHQVYDTASSNLKINALVSTAYPYAVTTKELTGPDARTTLTLDTDLTKTPFTQRPGFALVLQDDADWEHYCGDDALIGRAHSNDKLCDHDDSKGVSLGDFVVVGNGGDAFYAHNAGDAEFFGSGSSVALPAQQCPGDLEGASACRQNVFLRLKRRDSYCDLNLGLTLTVNAVCRDDYAGNGDDADSIVSTFWNGAGAAPVAGWPVKSSERLFVAVSGSRLACDSAAYRSNALDGPEQDVSFSLSSDYLCGRALDPESPVPADDGDDGDDAGDGYGFGYGFGYGDDGGDGYGYGDDGGYGNGYGDDDDDGYGYGGGDDDDDDDTADDDDDDDNNDQGNGQGDDESTFLGLSATAFAISVAGVGFLVGVVCACLCFVSRRRRHDTKLAGVMLASSPSLIEGADEAPTRGHGTAGVQYA